MVVLMCPTFSTARAGGQQDLQWIKQSLHQVPGRLPGTHDQVVAVVSVMEVVAAVALVDVVDAEDVADVAEVVSRVPRD